MHSGIYDPKRGHKQTTGYESQACPATQSEVTIIAQDSRTPASRPTCSRRFTGPLGKLVPSAGLSRLVEQKIAVAPGLDSLRPTALTALP